MNCDELLSSSSLVNPVINSAENLSPAANAYVNLMRIYAEKVGPAADVEIEKILKSNGPLDPFLNRTDSVGLQFSSALQRLKARIKPSEWIGIQNVIASQQKTIQANNLDKDAKSEATAFVFSPGEVVGKDFAHNIYTGTVSWQIIGDKTYAAIIEDKNLYIYELVNGVMEQRAKYKSTRPLHSEPTWRIVKGKIYISVVEKIGLRLLEFVGQKDLVSRDYKKIGKEVYYDVTVQAGWFEFKGQTYVSVGSVTGQFRVYQLVKGKLKLLKTLETSENSSTPSWQVIDGRAYLILGNVRGEISLYEFKSNTLKLLNTITFVGTAKAKPTWQIVDDEVFVVTTAGTQEVHLKVENDQLIVLSAELQGMSEDQATWERIAGRTFMAINRATGFSIFEAQGGKLIEKVKRASAYSEPAWGRFDWRYLVAIPGDKVIDICDFDGDVLSCNYQVPFDDAVSNLYWHEAEDQLSLIVMTPLKRIYTIGLFSKFTKDTKEGAGQ